jgi:inner membrane protein
VAAPPGKKCSAFRQPPRWRNGSNVSYRPRCPRDASANPTAVTRAVEGPASPGVRWLFRHDADLPALRALARDDCRFRAFLRFARAPYAGTLARGAPGANTARSAPGVVGDLRYDRSPGLDFSDLPLDRAAPCPKRVPPWIPPRSDLFGPLE